MEFGIFLNGYIPGPASRDFDKEHEMLMREVEYTVFADQHNWKYAWFGEHHALTEYSHMSAPEIPMAYAAAQTDYIHMSSGINSLSPRKEHPVRYAERAAMLDHITNGRYEWGTGRGAGSHELASFDILDKNSTKPEWEEVIREIPRMWEQRDYEYHGEHFTVPYPHNILPKPLHGSHPPIWVACGNPGTFSRAGELGIGAIAFNFEPVYSLKGRIDAYKEAIANCTDPVGQYKNDNVMITNAVVCLSDRKRAREIAMTRGRGYLYSLVCLYHDTMPKPDYAPTWPAPPHDPPATEEMLDELIQAGWLLCGTPDEVAEQVARYEQVGTDQVVFGLPGEGLEHEEVLECLELFGDKVIPEYDTDRVHSTTRYRAAATRKYPEITHPVPDIKVEIIPNTALLPLDA